MKKLTLSRLTPDPLTKAHAQAGEDTMTIHGYVRSADEDTIAICEEQSGKSYVEYLRSAVIAAFEEGEDSERVAFVIKSNAKVRIIRTAKAKEIKGDKPCGCSDSGVQEARPLSSIDAALAAFAAEVRKNKAAAGKGSIELKCAEARADCFRKGGTVEECDQAFNDCLFTSTFG